MAKGILLVCCFLFTSLSAFAQDLITRTDGVIIKASVLELTPTIIRFKLYQQPDTLVYQISTKDVLTVQMQDGTIRHFAPSHSTETTKTSQALTKEEPGAPFNYEQNSRRNILWIAPFDLLFTNVTIAYERISATGKIGIKVPLTINLSGTSAMYYDDFRRNNRFETGLEIKLYPSGQGKFRYYVGPSFLVRSFWTYYYDYNSPTPADQRVNAQLYSLSFKVGFVYQFSRHFSLATDLGLGYRIFHTPTVPSYTSFETRNRFYLPGNIHLGFRF